MAWIAEIYIEADPLRYKINIMLGMI